MAEKDISMVDVSDALEDILKDQKLQTSHQSQDASPLQPPAQAQPQRRKLTLILTEEAEKMHVEEGEHQSGRPENSGSQTQTGQERNQQLHSDHLGLDSTLAQTQALPANNNTPPLNVAVPVDIKWLQGGEKVYVTGSFTGWRKMIGLQKQEDNSFMVTLGLQVGTHRFRFVVDNELRYSDFLPTATDQMGNFVNYIEVTPDHVQMHLKQQEEILREQMAKEEESAAQRAASQHRGRSMSINRGRLDSIFGFINDDDDMGNGYLRYHEDADGDPQLPRRYNYVNDIPPIFVDPKVMELYYLAIDEQVKSKNNQQQAWLYPPQLPPHLENVILNNFNSQDKDNNSGALPIPNHVILNHLATTSIKHNTLAVASVVRYKRKYVTQVLYAPLQS